MGFVERDEDIDKLGWGRKISDANVVLGRCHRTKIERISKRFQCESYILTLWLFVTLNLCPL
jgi:hypothetical protein